MRIRSYLKNYKLNNFFGKFIVNDRHTYFYLITILVVSLVATTLSYIIYCSYTSNLKKNLETTATRIDNLLTDIYNETNNLMIYIGKQIAQKNPENLNYIAHLLKNTSGNEYKSKNLLSWTVFDWVDNNNLQMVNSVKGVASNPVNMLNRDYTRKCRMMPWSLQVSQPAIGTPSGIWVIPAGTGVTNKSGDFLGMIVIGFSIAELTENLKKKLNGDKASYMILDENFNTILKSPDNTSIAKDSEIKDLIKDKFDKSNPIEGTLSTPIQYHDITYSSYKKMEKFPYIILTGLDHHIYIKELSALVLPAIIVIFSMGILSIILLHISRKRIIQINKKSDLAKEAFISRINQKLQKNIDTILQKSYILNQYHKGEIQIGMNEVRKEEFISQIYETALQLKNLNTNTLHLTKIDVNALIQESINIHSKTALQKNIQIKTELNPFLPHFEADDLCIKQIIVSLLSYSLEYTPTGGSIWVRTDFKIIQDYLSEIILTIRDDSFELTEQDIIRIKHTFYEEKEQKDSVNLDFETIEKLVKLHHGSCEVQPIEGRGRMATLTFPYLLRNNVKS